MAHGSTRGSLTEGAWLTLRALAALLLAIGFYVAVLTLVGVLLFIAGTGLFYGKLLFLKVALFLLAAAGAILSGHLASPGPLRSSLADARSQGGPETLRADRRGGPLRRASARPGRST